MILYDFMMIQKSMIPYLTIRFDLVSYNQYLTNFVLHHGVGLLLKYQSYGQITMLVYSSIYTSVFK